MVYVITGGPGFGKTSVINCLAELGYPVCPENARELLSSHHPTKRSAGETDLPADFERIIAGARLSFLETAEKDRIAFSDRGLPDQVAYSRYKKKIPSSFIDAAARRGRYADPVFITPPWREIYVNDDVRQESFEEASAIHDLIVRAYTEYGYRVVEIPLAEPADRAQFILNFPGVK